LRYVQLTSYGFLQTLPLPENALAIRIVFPLVGATTVSFNRPGLPATRGKQKTPLDRLVAVALMFYIKR